ncbi:MAPEG family protein [Phenylobacterium sp.]|uniref:MAPEG family protein n=1 Tax=Phenylobacterium sp. TaxID=1871053 RepID=UPI00272F9C64|nr:MAPEG family protein [Phenylobacterium sp.]MDP1601159.1 MAPEG family protein [Phenylobacterium sp.]
MRSSPPIVDLPKEQRAVRRQATFAFAVCALILGIAVFGLPRLFAFPDDLVERLTFALRADLLIGLWVILAVRQVAKIRFESAEDNAGSAYSRPSARLAVPAAFLQNTLEQALILALGILALATVPGERPLAYIAASVVLFSLGRVTFLRGYARGAGGRAFGVATTALPGLGAYLWTIIAVGSELAALAR